MSRLFFVIALLISGIPIFSVTQIFGGVSIHNIVMSFLIAAATAFVTGSLAMAIATFKVGTRRTIFSFYLFMVIYLVGLFLLDKLPYFHVAGPKNVTHQLVYRHSSVSRAADAARRQHLPAAGNRAVAAESSLLAIGLVPDKPGNVSTSASCFSSASCW